MSTTALIPIRDDNPTGSTPILTIALIVANVVVFFMEPQLGQGRSCALNDFFFRWGVIPREVTNGEPLMPVICGRVLEGKSVYLSLITSMFLHGGLLHLGGNMLFLWVFGNNIEDTLGKARFLVFYFAAGIVATLAHVLINAQSAVPTVGASGAVSGLLGAYIVLFPHAQVTTAVPIFFFLSFIRLPAMVVLGFWFVSQFFIAGGQQVGEAGVAWMAHVGGFLAGMALIFILGGWSRRRKPRAAFDWPAG